jgi:hypothetical protein
MRRVRAELLRLVPGLLAYVADRVGVVSQSTNRAVVRAWRQSRAAIRGRNWCAAFTSGVSGYTLSYFPAAATSSGL